MAITGAKPGGTFYQFDNLANDGAVVAFKVREFCPERLLTPQSSSPVNPVVVDLVVLGKWDGAAFQPCADHKHVVRGEQVIGAGITGSLRRSTIGDDVICVMGWGKRGATNYVQANSPDQAIVDAAIAVFQATNGDPYTAAERAAAPAATVVAATPPPAPAPVAPPAAPAADPGLGAAPWAAPAAASSTTAPEPVAAGSVW